LFSKNEKRYAIIQTDKDKPIRDQLKTTNIHLNVCQDVLDGTHMNKESEKHTVGERSTVHLSHDLQVVLNQEMNGIKAG
jgi:hypothetical protein